MPSHYPLIDAHTHLGSDSEQSERQKKQILSLVCASTPPEAEALLKTAKPYLLAIACQMKKPVILHTKGEEDRIASILPEYPNTYLVHWYSCEEYLDQYLALGCYFSIGPDVLWNPPVRTLADRVPQNRILIETDGMGAVKWAYEAPEAPKNSQLADARENTKNVEDALTHTLLETAAIRQTKPGVLAKQIQKNLIWGFLSASK